MIKAHTSGRMVSSGISEIATASELPDKKYLKKFIKNKSKKMTVFDRRQKLTSAMKLRPEK